MITESFHIAYILLFKRKELIKEINNLKTNNMPTKCIDLEDLKSPTRIPKPIELKIILSFDGNVHHLVKHDATASAWDSVELVRRSNTEGLFDIIFAYDKHRQLGQLYLGHWNDGVV